MAFGSGNEDDVMDARTRAFSQALHDQLGRNDHLDDRYRYLLALASVLGGYASVSAEQHYDALRAIATAQTISDRTNPRRAPVKVRSRS
jgi:hypothetical protein